MNSNKEIEALIEKYNNGETSLQEEEQLQNFFRGEDVPDHLKEEQAWFAQLDLRAKTEWEGFSEDKLFEKLDAQVKQEEAKVVPMLQPKTKQVWLYRVAAAVALVLVGFYMGNKIRNNDVAGVKEELVQVKAMMLEQMTSTSASGRLQAVNYSIEFKEVDQEMLNALINVLETDENMNVRLKAVEGLAKFYDEPTAKKALLKALKEEKEPMMQIALIDVLVENNEKAALDDLERIAEDGNSIKGVKEQAYMGMFKLKEM